MSKAIGLLRSGCGPTPFNHEVKRMASEYQSMSRKNELERCIDDYQHVPGYLASTANHEKGLLLEIYRHGKNKQLILSPDGNFFEIHPTRIFDAESINIDEVIDDYGGYEAVAHEIDRVIGAHNMAVAKRHKEVCPEKYDKYGLLKY